MIKIQRETTVPVAGVERCSLPSRAKFNFARIRLPAGLPHGKW